MTVTDARSRLDAVIERELTEDELTRLVREAKAGKKKEWVTITCSECHTKRKYEVETTSAPAAIDNVTKLLEQAKGKVGQAAKQATSQALTDITEMTDEQLAAVIAGIQVEDPAKSNLSQDDAAVTRTREQIEPPVS